MNDRGFRHPHTQTKRVKAEIKRLCANLQGRRLAVGLTQEEFAEKADISLSMIRQVETGKRIPSLPMLVYLAQILGQEVHLKG